MKYYFGLVPTEDVDSFGEEGLFESGGAYFYNQIEFGSNPGGTEDFVITDGCDRSIPLSVEHIDSLISILNDIRGSMSLIADAEALHEAINDENHVQNYW